MDKLLESRKKHLSSVPATGKIKESISTTANQLIKQYEEDVEQIRDEERKLDNLKEEIKHQKEELMTENQKYTCLLSQLQNQTEILKELVGVDNKLYAENEKTELEKEKMETIKSNPKDDQVLEHGRKRLQYYKTLTGIHWDYPMIHISTAGFIRTKDYISPFKLNGSETDTETKLWAEIEKAVLPKRD